MLFEQRFWAGLADGSVTTTFRRWKRRQVVAGHRYRTAGGILEVDAVDVVDSRAITEREARRSGYESAAQLVADLRGSPDRPLYRVRFHRVEEPDPRSVLAETAELSERDVEALDRRLDRLDRASRRGPWTTEVLALIARHPGVRAGDLAATLGVETPAFKADVRKLKNLGLTLSLEVGYRLSPRGQAYRRRV